jgi:hypothetical protein
MVDSLPTIPQCNHLEANRKDEPNLEHDILIAMECCMLNITEVLSQV